MTDAPESQATKAVKPAKAPKETKETKETKAPKAAPAPKAKKTEEPETPERRPTPELSASERRLLVLRTSISHRRPKFVRNQSHRYWRIGRRDSWRAPRGVQSKMRRHYKYRGQVVSIGFRGPAAVRGRTALGLRPVLVHHADELEELVPTKDLVVIARPVGTRKRLVLEEVARKKGLRVANPLSRGGGEEE